MSFFYISELSQLPDDLEPLSLIIGNFDGIHLGHQELVKTSLKWSKANHGSSMVLSFEPHPVAVLNPQLQHSRLFSLADQRQQFQARGLRGIFIQDFNLDFRNLTAEQFLQNYILKEFSPRHLVVGHDFGFGKSRSGNIALLKSFAQKNNILLEVVSPLQLEGETVSTSKIREALSVGQMEKAQRLLGRPYCLHGMVVHGSHRGAGIGFPTANLKADILSVSLKRGVYCTKSLVDGKWLAAVTNVGVNPTVSEDQKVKIETHIFDFSRSLYDEPLSLEFYHHLRDEKKFSSLDELKLQIKKDADLARDYFR